MFAKDLVSFSFVFIYLKYTSYICSSFIAYER